MVRFDPKLSKDYNCIFVEGHSAKGIAVRWLCRSTPIEFLRLRYTPNDEHQAYGIMFIDPRTMAFEAHDCCVAMPTHLGSRLTSPKLLAWLRSQPHSAEAASHTNDASEIFSTISALKPCDMEHFSLATNFPLHNFVIGHQSLADRGGPNLLTLSLLVMMLAPMISRIAASGRSAAASPAGPVSNFRI